MEQVNGLLDGMPLAVKSGPKIGFVLSHEQFAVPQLVELGLTAEEAGFDTVWTSDHFQPWQDNQGHAGFAWITLAALGQRISRIPMGTGVTCPTYRYNPAIVAEAFASLGLLYPGRVFLGVGTGEALNEVAAGGGWGDYEERAVRLEEAVSIIRQLWSGTMVNHQGQYYQVNNAKLYDVPPMPIPIYIAAGGEKSMEMAGRIGDGLITDSERAIMPNMRQAFEKGAREAGKDPRTMPIIAEHWVCVGEDNEARQLAQLWQFLPKAWDEFVDDPDPRDIQQRAQQEVKVDEVLKSWVVSKDPGVHVRKIQELIEQGVTTIYVHSAQPDQRKVINFYSSEVLPRLRQRR
jgi:TAT-translocated FGD2 family F420-dependent dehydrogenase